jgi:hypothetical protein
VAAALYDESQVVVASKIYGGNYMGWLSGRDGIHARRGLPRVQPSRDLRATRLIADVEGICEVLKGLATTRVSGSPLAGTEQGGHLEKMAVDGRFQALPGCRGWPGGIRGSNPAHGFESACRSQQRSRGAHHQAQGDRAFEEIPPVHVSRSVSGSG